MMICRTSPLIRKVFCCDSHDALMLFNFTALWFPIKIFLMKLFPISFVGTINQIQCTCVLESDFGFSINCNFKKAGLFRVRNLGGVKAHFGLGKALAVKFTQFPY